MIKQILFSAFAAVVALVPNLYSESQEMHVDALNSLLLHAPSSIERITDGKVFLKPERIHFYQRKICVEGECGEAIPVPHVFSNETGLYIYANEKKSHPIWICKVCTCSHAYEPKECERCGKTGFIIRFVQ